MDQIKTLFRQLARHRFWIAFGISLLLPMIGYFLGSGAIVQATTTQVAAIKGAQTEIEKYKASNLPNAQYQPIVTAKTEALVKDVDATWRKLFAIQEPLLRWPDVVETKFRSWGRKWPENVDRGQIQQAIYDYTIAYPDFVKRLYQTCKPWNPDDGTGIVAVPDSAVLMVPAPFSLDTPPELGKVWAEQERLWVLTALLDVVAKVNESVGAKDWDGAIIKQINLIEVGTPTAQDQKSLAKGEALEPAPELAAEGAAAAATATPTAGSESGSMGMMGMMGSAATKTDSVYSIKAEGPQQFKVLPIRISVLVDQAHLPDFLVGLENSPMAIQVMEPEISKPLTPVLKPVYGEKLNFGMMGMSGPGMTMGGESGGSAMMGRGMNPMMGRNPMGNSGGGMPESGMMGMMGMMGNDPAATAKKGINNRGKTNKAQERKTAEKEAAKAKATPKAKVDQYYNIIEVTVYGQARFYNAPPAPPEVQPSTAPATEAPTTEAVAPAPAGAPKVPQTPQPESPKTEAPKVPETPAKAETPATAPPAAPGAAVTPEAPAARSDGAAPKS